MIMASCESWPIKVSICDISGGDFELDRRKICPCDKEWILVTNMVFGSRGPPEQFLSLTKKSKLSIAE